MTTFTANEVTAFDLANQWAAAARQGFAHAIRFTVPQKMGRPHYILKVLLVPYVHEDSALMIAEFTLREARAVSATVSVKRFHVDDITSINDLYPEGIEDDSVLLVQDAQYPVLAFLLDSPDVGVSIDVFRRAWLTFGLESEYLVKALTSLSKSGMITVISEGQDITVWLASAAREILGEDFEPFDLKDLK